MRQDLMNALRLVRDYCKSVQETNDDTLICDNCLIYNECDNQFYNVPEDWDLDDDK